MPDDAMPDDAEPGDAMFDAHCHLDRMAGPLEPEGPLQRARAAGVTGFALAGVHPRRAAFQAALADREPGILWTAGLHPWWVDPETLDEDLEAVAAALDDPRWPVPPAAVGELGLDHVTARDDRARAAQRRATRAQLALARERDLPVVLHVVRAHGELLSLLEGDGVPAAGGMVHGFSGPIEVARRYLDLGLYIAVNGGVTRRGWKKLKAALPEIPRDRLLVETDSPDQCPEPQASAFRERGEEPVNEPAFLVSVVRAVAALRGEDPEGVAGYTARNAARLFGPPGRRRGEAGTS